MLGGKEVCNNRGAVPFLANRWGESGACYDRGTRTFFWPTAGGKVRRAAIGDRDSVSFFGQPLYLCLRRQAPQPRSWPVSTIAILLGAFLDYGIVHMGCSFIFVYFFYTYSGIFFRGGEMERFLK